MSEVKFNLTDAQHTLRGTTHGSIAEATIAALSAEPETIAELEAALARYIKPDTTSTPFASFYKSAWIDTEPWDAGIVIIDLAARIVASESSYSRPRPKGQVNYHDGTCATDTPVLYRLPDDWRFLSSIEEYECLRERRRQERAASPPLNARAVLYGQPLSKFIATETAGVTCAPLRNYADESIVFDNAHQEANVKEISALHARWLMTPRDDLRGQSPREVLLARQEQIDYDLETRSMQWSLQNEGPPCLATDSFAYRFAGFGTHEWVIYYDLVRHLLWSALETETGGRGDGKTGGDSDAGTRRADDAETPGLPDGDRTASVGAQQIWSGVTRVCQDRSDIDSTMARLEELKADWLEQSQPDYDGRIPALLIENERKRLPIAMLGRDMVIDDECPMCQMMGDESAFGLEVGFWHLDGAHMDDDFAFSHLRTREEWEAENREREQFNKEFDRRWEERQRRIARGERVEHEFNLDWVDSFSPDPPDSNRVDDDV